VALAEQYDELESHSSISRQLFEFTEPKPGPHMHIPFRQNPPVQLIPVALQGSTPFVGLHDALFVVLRV
jgi:hypothetical protein